VPDTGVSPDLLLRWLLRPLPKWVRATSYLRDRKRRRDVPLQAPFAGHGNGGQRLRVLDVVPFDEEDESEFVGLLQIEAA
jgi:hypothetical protein